MGLVSGLVLYVSIWMIVWFAVLPWHVTIPEKTEIGFADSAPEKTHLKLKVLVTSLIAFIIWLFFALGYHKDLVDLSQ